MHQVGEKAVRSGARKKARQGIRQEVKHLLFLVQHLGQISGTNDLVLSKRKVGLSFYPIWNPHPFSHIQLSPIQISP